MSRPGIVGAIIAKDLKAFSRDRFLLVMTLMGLAFYVAVFWVLPDAVDETITLGVAPSEAGALLGGILGEEGAGVELGAHHGPGCRCPARPCARGRARAGRGVSRPPVG